MFDESVAVASSALPVSVGPAAVRLTEPVHHGVRYGLTIWFALPGT